MEVLYYYYYLFYTRVLPDDEPHATVVFTLSFSEALLVNYAVDFLAVHLFCEYLLSMWSMIGVFLLILGVNYLIFHRTGRNREIVERKPSFFGNRRLSIVVTLLFFVTTTSLLFWGADYLMYVIDQCK